MSPARKNVRRVAAKSVPSTAPASPPRTFDALPDPADFRDLLFTPTLVEVPTQIPLEEYTAWQVPILDQGPEGACTGFGLTTVANYLLRRRRRVPDANPVSPRMFYQMAKRYDEWPGSDYEGSSARGAMKGWHKHGVCAASTWEYIPKDSDLCLTEARATDAVRRPLGAYFRVNPKDLIAMHSALAEVGVLYATAMVHSGWNQPTPEGIIPQGDRLGGHAFAIVAYDADGFWIQNSWGPTWGRGGLAQLTYDDWLSNSMDAWVARLGAPVRLRTAAASSVALAPEGAQSDAYTFSDLRPHIVSIGNDGALRTSGTYGTSRGDLARIFEEDYPRLTEKWSKPKLLLYAHGGLVDEKSAVQRLADYRPALLDAQVYPISFIWKTDYWTTLKNILDDASRRRRPEGPIEAAKDFLLNRLDDMLEPVARVLSGKLQWDEMKENALRSSQSAQGGAALAAGYVRKLLGGPRPPEVHLLAHSAGAIFLAPLVQLLTTDGKITSGPLKGRTGYNLRITSCTLWAPACTIGLAKETYVPAVIAKQIRRFALYTLTDRAEQDDNCAGVYHKSLLYLVSHALEARARIPLVREGTPLFGMQKFVDHDDELRPFLGAKNVEWVLAPNTAPDTSAGASRASGHGAFDDDAATVRSTLARVLAATSAPVVFQFHRSASKSQERRQQLVRHAVR